MGFILIIVAYVLLIALSPLGVVYAFFRLMINNTIARWFNYFNRLFFKLAISLDQFANVLFAPLFNDVLIKSKTHTFGNEDETISSVLGKNQRDKTLRKAGKVLCFILDKLDKDHCKKSIGK